MGRVGVEVVLFSGRTLKQGQGLETGKLGEDYFNAVNYCELDSTTMEVLGVSEGDPVEIETIHGSVVVYARLGRDAEPGKAFIPVGPYANAVVGDDTCETGTPDFKGLRAKVFDARGQRVLSVKELLTEILEGVE